MIVVTTFRLHFEPNGIPFGSKSKGKLSSRSYPIQFERKWKYSFLSAEKSFRNLVNPNQSRNVITIFRQIQHQTEFRLVLSLSENGNYIPALVWVNKIPKRFPCVCIREKKGAILNISRVQHEIYVEVE